MRYIPIVMAALLLFVVPAKAQECPVGMSYKENLAGVDAAVKAGKFKQAVIFKHTNPNDPTEYILFMLIDAEGMAIAFHFVNDCAAPFPDGSMFGPVQVDEKFMKLLSTAEVVFEGGDVKEFLKLKKFMPKQGDGA